MEPNPCQLTIPYYITSSTPTDKRIYSSQNFKLSTCMPDDKVIHALVAIQAVTQDQLYLLCPKYKDSKGDDIQLGITETQNNGFERLDHCALRGLVEELQIGTTPESIEYRRDLDYNSKSKNYSTFFLDTRNHTIVHQEATSESSSRYRGNKSLVCVYGTYQNLEETLLQFNPTNQVTYKDDIDALALIPIKELEYILNHHKAKFKL